MAKRYLISLLLFALTANIFAQIPKKRLPQNINVPTYSHIFPSLSGDGNQMIYLTNYTNSEGFETKYTVRNGAESWEDPESIQSINRPGQDQIGSFCLSYDGNFVVFASRRTPSIGNFDIFISEKVGNNWTVPQNPGKPLNSTAHEGSPSLSPDGKSIYFTRCESMDNTTKRNCAIYVSHRVSSTRWSEPEKLPDFINTSHETTPRIMADNKTLIFASGRPGGKGKLDLYQSTLQYGSWSKPIALSYINTPENDEFVSIPARGDLIYFTGTYRDKYNLFKAIIPEEFRPQKVLMITGNVNYSDGQNPSEDVIIQAYDLTNGDVYTTTRLRQNDNSFTIFLPEGTKYDLSAFPQKKGHTYYSQIIDLENMPISRKEEMAIDLSPISDRAIIPLNTIRFEEYSANLSSESDIELKRIVGFLKKNPGVKLEIGAFIDSVFTDTIPSNDLTEIIADTVFYTIDQKEELLEDELAFEDFDDTGADSLAEQTQEDDALAFEELNDTLEATVMDPRNALRGDVEEIAELTEDSSVGSTSDLFLESSPADSLLALGFSKFKETEKETIYFKINYTYHNDRTEKQAKAVLDKLIEAGVPEDLLEAKGYGDNWQQDRAEEERNYWIELKVMH